MSTLHGYHIQPSFITQVIRRICTCNKYILMKGDKCIFPTRLFNGSRHGPPYRAVIVFFSLSFVYYRPVPSQYPNDIPLIFITFCQLFCVLVRSIWMVIEDHWASPPVVGYFVAPRR